MTKVAKLISYIELTLEGCFAHKEWVLKSCFMVLSDNCYPSKIMGYYSSTADMNFFFYATLLLDALAVCKAAPH